MTAHQRGRLRKLAEQLKSADPTHGDLEGVMALAVLDCLGEIERLLDVLRLFALAAENIEENPPEDDRPSHGRGIVKAGDLRRVRAIVRESK